MKRNNKKGFTLAELLIVVAIIGILVAISIPVFTQQLKKARLAVNQANARAAYAAALASYTETGYGNDDGGGYLDVFHGIYDVKTARFDVNQGGAKVENALSNNFNEWTVDTKFSGYGDDASLGAMVMPAWIIHWDNGDLYIGYSTSQWNAETHSWQ